MALVDLANTLRGRDIDIAVDVDPAVAATLSEAEENVIFRVAQECMRNAAKHSRGSLVTVQVCHTPGSVVLEVGDNGRGFDVAATLDQPEPGHLGLRLLLDLCHIAQRGGGTISVRHAGHAVLASGVTVAISLVALVVVPVPLLQSMGYGGMLIPLCRVLVVLTLLPALLASVGRRVDIPHIRKEGVASKGWTAWAGSSSRVGGGRCRADHPRLRIAPLRHIQFGQSSTKSQGTASAAYKTLQTLENGGIGSGVAHADRAAGQKGSPAQSRPSPRPPVPCRASVRRSSTPLGPTASRRST